jgi:hypothetical protein
VGRVHDGLVGLLAEGVDCRGARADPCTAPGSSRSRSTLTAKSIRSSSGNEGCAPARSSATAADIEHHAGQLEARTNSVRDAPAAHTRMLRPYVSRMSKVSCGFLTRGE